MPKFNKLEQSKLRVGLNFAIVREKPNVKWSHVVGLESAKQALQEAVILPVKFPHFFTVREETAMARFSALRASWNWKSYLAKAVATEADSTFYRQSCRSLGLRVLDTMMKKSLCWQQQIHHMLLIRLFGECIYIPPQLGLSQAKRCCGLLGIEAY